MNQLKNLVNPQNRRAECFRGTVYCVLLIEHILCYPGNVTLVCHLLRLL